MEHTLYWKAEANEEEDVRNPRARAADKAEVRLEGRLQRRRDRLEAQQRRQWNWTA